jgi:hypothetical protein
MLEELQRRNFAATTIRTYLHGVAHFSRYYRRLAQVQRTTNLVSHLRDSIIVAKVGHGAERDPISSPHH